MKNKELFYKSVNILQKAYFNGTLSHGDPCGCAVGNLVKANNNVQKSKFLHYSYRPDWWFGLIGKKFSNDLNDVCTEEEGLKQINNIGYSLEEASRIEKAFEKKDDGFFNRDTDGYLGLCAVLDVLMEIHEFNKEEIKLPDNTKIFNKEELVLIQE